MTVEAVRFTCGGNVRVKPARASGITQLAYRLALILFVLAIFVAGYQLFGFPSSKDLRVEAISLLRSYGLPIVFAAAFLEAFFVVGWYFPGTFILVITVAFSSAGEIPFPYVATVFALGLLTAYVADYLLGLLGWYAFLAGTNSPVVARAIRFMTRYGPLGFVLAAIHPNSGGAAAVAAGALRFRPRTFVLVAGIAATLWSAIWTAALAVLGEAILPFLDLRIALLGGAFILTVVFVVGLLRRGRV